MSEMTEQERDAAVIARSPQRYADLRAITELRSFSPEETVLLVRVANAGADLIQAQHRTIDRLTAERDAAHEKIVSFGSTMADLIMLRSENTRLEAETIESAAILEKAVKESKAIVAGYNRAIEERDAARAENMRLRAACKEASDYLNSSSLREGSDEYASLNADDILRAALGIESEASE